MHHSSGKSAGATRTLLSGREGVHSRTASQSVSMSPLRTAAPCGRPAHGMGDGAGRSPGSRVVAFIRPSRFADFAACQWSYADEGSPLTVAGAATDYCERRSDRVPSFLPGATRGTNAWADHLHGAIQSQDDA